MTITATRPKLAYYSYDKVLSYNAVLNIIVGARGLGKTFGAKDKYISKALKGWSKDPDKHCEQFILLRRYTEELQITRDSFMADIAHKFPDWDFKIGKDTIVDSPPNVLVASPRSEREVKKGRAWRTIAYFVPLSTAQNRKGVSYHHVRTIIFDEFIIEKGAIHYLPNEAVALINFYSTVDRNRDEVRVLMLSNSVTMDNPYFLYFDIRPDQVGEFLTAAPDNQGRPFVVCHFVESAEFSKGVYATRFGQFIQGTDYADYAVESNFADNHDNMLELKTATAQYYCTIETIKGTFSVWIDYKSQPLNYYVQERRPKKENLFTLIPERMEPNKKLLTQQDKVLQYMRTGFRSARMYFDSPKSRNSFIEIFRR